MGRRRFTAEFKREAVRLAQQPQTFGNGYSGKPAMGKLAAPQSILLCLLNGT